MQEREVIISLIFLLLSFFFVSLTLAHSLTHSLTPSYLQLAMAALSYTFRLRPQNPYFMLEDYAGFDEAEASTVLEMQVSEHTNTKKKMRSSARNKKCESKRRCFMLEDNADN